MRIACGLAYDGTEYAGWQWQVNTPTIQAKVEQAISQIATHKLRVICAGRTDQGVHANNQVIHFNTDCERAIKAWHLGINYYLPHDIRLLWLQIVDDNFHARYSAVRRSYRYVIYQGSMPWFRKYSWMTSRPLQLEAMQEAACHLVGQHDFSAFRSAHCQSPSSIRHLTQLTLHQTEGRIQIDITANAFLHHMVRNIVGTLVEVGQDKRTPDSIVTLLNSHDRRQAGITAPPQGLYLRAIYYPEQFKLPSGTV